MMSFLSTVVTSLFPSTNNEQRNSSSPRQQATIHDGWVTIQPLRGRQNSYAVGTSGIIVNTSGTGGNYLGNGKVLNEEELEFLADPGIAEGPVTQSVITHTAAYQADNVDAYDSDRDKISTAKAILMANLSSYGSDVLFEVPYSDNTNNNMLNQTVQDTNSSTQQDAMILSVFEQLSNQVTNCNKVNEDNLLANETLSAELKRYKERVKLLENMDLRDDPIDAINKMMSFLSTVITSCFPSTNNRLRNSSNPRQQETIHDGRVTVQPLQGRPNSYGAGTSGIRANTSGTGGNYSGQQRVVEAQGNGKVLNEEELEFLADPGIAEGLVSQSVITHNAAYQAARFGCIMILIVQISSQS
ncbi:hypothetical protein Tco_0950335 [Tanacetum coccineum]